MEVCATVEWSSVSHSRPPTALSAVISGESFLGPATCEGLLLLIEAWTSDYTNMYKIG